mmetsp:Transcript_138823/g.276846  ORF Transcript_138823/g.276846 Transcript_138823/m.276846 type:complete len:89 (-) Transcript_138823:177-443(-)
MGKFPPVTSQLGPARGDAVPGIQTMLFITARTEMLRGSACNGSGWRISDATSAVVGGAPGPASTRIGYPPTLDDSPEYWCRSGSYQRW